MDPGGALVDPGVGGWVVGVILSLHVTIRAGSTAGGSDVLSAEGVHTIKIS